MTAWGYNIPQLHLPRITHLSLSGPFLKVAHIKQILVSPFAAGLATLEVRTSREWIKGMEQYRDPDVRRQEGVLLPDNCDLVLGLFEGDDGEQLPDVGCCRGKQGVTRVTRCKAPPHPMEVKMTQLERWSSSSYNV